MPLLTRRIWIGSVLASGSLLDGCSRDTGRGGDRGLGKGTAQPNALIRPVALADVRWLDRVGFGAIPASIRRLPAIGREAYLDEQLALPPADPCDLTDAIAALPGLQQTAEQGFRAFLSEKKRINGLTDEVENQCTRSALNRAGNDMVQDASCRHLLRGLYSPA